MRGAPTGPASAPRATMATAERVPVKVPLTNPVLEHEPEHQESRPGNSEPEDKKSDFDRSSTASEASVWNTDEEFDIEMGAAVRDLKGEDAFATVGPIVIGEDTVYITAVFDGHGGKVAAHLCRDRLISYLLEGVGQDASGESFGRAATAAFHRAHEMVRSMGVNDGTTATVCALNVSRREITTLSAGDSLAMLVSDERRGPTAVHEFLTPEHRIESSAAERERLQKLGARIAPAEGPGGMPEGPLRLWPGGVVQARAIGDADCGKFIDPTPEVSTIPFPQCCGFSLLVCSDGVWDAMAPSSIASQARKARKQAAGRAAETVVESVARHYNAQYGRLRDDATCCLLCVRGGAAAGGSSSASSTAETVSSGGGMIRKALSRISLSFGSSSPPRSPEARRRNPPPTPPSSRDNSTHGGSAFLLDVAPANADLDSFSLPCPSPR
jgi:serine/threonine protein phosphatase PrpC